MFLVTTITALVFQSIYGVNAFISIDKNVYLQCQGQYTLVCTEKSQKTKQPTGRYFFGKFKDNKLGIKYGFYDIQCRPAFGTISYNCTKSMLGRP